MVTVADYCTFQQLAQTLGIAETSIRELQAKGLLQPTVKNGRTYFSSQQAYRLRAAVRQAHRDRIDFEEAFAKVEERWLAYVSSTKE
jgi:DNA-binding transcriptional MerR regulator